MDMTKVIKITESELKQMVKEALNVHYSSDNIPKYQQEVTKIIHDGKKFGNRILTIIKSLTIGEIMENPSKYQKMYQDIVNMVDHYSKMNNKYYDIHSALEDNEENNDQINEFYHQVSNLDSLWNDLDDMRMIFSEMIDTVIDGSGQIKSKIKDFETDYPSETINITQHNTDEN